MQTEIGDTAYNEELGTMGYHFVDDPDVMDEIREFLGEDWPEATGFITFSEDGAFEEIWVTDDRTPASSHASFIRLR